MEVFEGKSDGVQARGIWSNSSARGVRSKPFIILEGSGAVGDDNLEASFDRAGRKELRQELISNGTLTKDGDRYRFQKDHTFNSPSQAASIVWGSNRNGKEKFGINEVSPLSPVRTSPIDEAPQPSPVLTSPIDEAPQPSPVPTFFPIDDERAVEGYKKDQQLYVTTRNTDLAKRRKQHDGYTCQACGFKLEVSGHFVIECHHTNPISWGVRETSLDDLVSLCPTCHRIAHTREPIYTVAEINSIRQG